MLIGTIINTWTLSAGKGQPMANGICWEVVLYPVVKKARKTVAQTNSNLTDTLYFFKLILDARNFSHSTLIA